MKISDIRNITFQTQAEATRFFAEQALYGKPYKFVYTIDTDPSKVYYIDEIVGNAVLLGSGAGGAVLFPNGFEDVTESRNFQHSDVGKALRLAADDVFLTMPEGQFWTEEEKGQVIVVIADAVNVGFDKTFETPVLMQSRDGDNSMVGEYCLLVTGETDGQSDFGTISTAIIKDGTDWKTAIRYLYDNSGGGSSALVPTNDEIAMNIRLLFPNEFTDVGGNIWEYALQQEDAGKLIIMYVDADVYPDEYRVTIPDDLCIGLPNEIMKVGFFVVDGNCWWQNGSGGGFVKQLSLADAVNVVNTGSGGEGAFVILTATEGATLASVDVTLVNKQGTYYTPDYWQFRNDLYLHPIVEGASYHLKEGKNVLYGEGLPFDEITIYVDSNINFKYEEVEVLISSATIANVIWKDNDDDETDITNVYGLPSSMKTEDFVRLKNQTGNDFIVLENHKSPAYYVYSALLSQSGTDAPTAIVLENNIGANIAWSRNASGDYTGTLVGAFTEDKTFISYNAFSDVTLNHAVELVRVDEDTLQLWTVSTGTGSTIDSVLNKTCVEIKVYK